MVQQREKVEGFSVCGSGFLHRRPYKAITTTRLQSKWAKTCKEPSFFFPEDYDGIMVREKMKVILTVKLNVGWYLYSDQHSYL